MGRGNNTRNTLAAVAEALASQLTPKNQPRGDRRTPIHTHWPVRRKPRPAGRPISFVSWLLTSWCMTITYHAKTFTQQ